MKYIGEKPSRKLEIGKHWSMVESMTWTDYRKEILLIDTIKLGEMKKKDRKKYIKMIKKLLKTKLCTRTLINGLNIWAISFVRYSKPFLN